MCPGVGCLPAAAFCTYNFVASDALVCFDVAVAAGLLVATVISVDDFVVASDD